MPLYFLLLDADPFRRRITPALAASRRQRSFEPCRDLCTDLLPAVEAFRQRYHMGPDEALLSQVLHGLPYDVDFWRSLAGEVLLYSAAEVPDFQTAPETLCCLLAPERYREGDVPRGRFAPIQQAHFGARDLVFGSAFFRPDHAGWNDAADVLRLAKYLTEVDPDRWQPNDLLALPEVGDAEEAAEELLFARERFVPLREMYQRAAGAGQIVVCEML
jgi:hypothetical protein